MNKSFFRGVLTGSILGTFVGIFSAPQKKPVQVYADKVPEESMRMGSKTRKVLKGITRGVSELIK